MKFVKNISQADGPQLILPVISVGRRAISQDPINEAAAAAAWQLQQSVNKSHFSRKLYMNSCWSHLEFGELINGRIGLKRQVKRERNDSSPTSSAATRNMRIFIVSQDLLHHSKVFKCQPPSFAGARLCESSRNKIMCHMSIPDSYCHLHRQRRGGKYFTSQCAPGSCSSLTFFITGEVSAPQSLKKEQGRVLDVPKWIFP